MGAAVCYAAVFLLTIYSASANSSHVQTAALIVKDGTATLVSDVHHPNAMATAYYLDSVHSISGWGQISVRTSSLFPDEQAMWAAGYLEGYMTAERIYDHHVNMQAAFRVNTSAPRDFLMEQDQWAREQVGTNGTSFWNVMSLLLAQHDGLMEGYAAAAAANSTARADGRPLPQLKREDFLALSAVGDLGDLVPALEPKKRVQWEALDPEALELHLASRGHCSALVKVTGNYSTLLLSHSSWFTYSGMVRIYKHYDFQLASPDHKLRKMSFSSYPGELSSDDDFYLLDTGLAVLQTTNDILDNDLYKLLTPHSVLNWQRVRVANAMATSGAEWADAVGTCNSGTYNNQYMVLDLKLFQPGQELRDNLLWIVEQVPGLSMAADETETLRRGYWPSYNVPYFREIYKRAGYLKLQDLPRGKGAAYADAALQKSYQLAPRATIFRRDVGSVTSMESAKRFMRSNSYRSDPYSKGRPLNAICGRGDLDPTNPRAYGCYDTKVADYNMALQLRAEGIVGPTGREAGLPPFRWDGEAFRNVSHQGQPDVFDFVFEPLSAKTLMQHAAQAPSVAL